MIARRAAFLLVVFSCANGSTSKPPQENNAQASVVLGTSSGGSVKVDVEIAATPGDRERGLMHRSSLAEGTGMLFLFPREETLTFWMKDTLIPLDMIFIRADMSVAGIIENAEPLTLTNRTVGTPSQYVLEVNGGWASKHEIAPGARVRFENVPPPPLH